MLQLISENMNPVIKIAIRPATLEDAEFLVRGNTLLALETENISLDMDRLRNGVHAMFDDPSRGFYLIAEVNGIRAGQMMITFEWSDWRNGVFWWIQSVYTVSEFRQQGVFRALYKHTESLARQQGGVCGLRLYVDGHNQAAQSTYQRCGMRETNYRLFEVDYVVAR